MSAALLAASAWLVFSAIGAHTHQFAIPGDDVLRVEACTVSASDTQACWSCGLAHSPATPAIDCLGNAPVLTPVGPSCQAGASVGDSLSRSQTSRGPPRVL